MRRWLTAVALGGAAALLLTACGKPAGVDGALTDDWAAVPSPKSFTPPAGTCYAADFADTAYLSAFDPVDCATSHRVETVHVGTLGGSAGKRSTPPPVGSAELRAAYAECDAKTAQYVGGAWRTGRLWMGMALPSAAAWAGGSRWFRCDVTEVTTIEDNGDTATRTASLRNALKAPSSPLRLGCYAIKLAKDDSIDTMPATSCAKPHNGEFAGVWKAPDIAYPTKDADWSRFHNECRSVIARYAGLPDDGNLKYRVGVISLPGGSGDWKAGNRGVRCYLWLSDRTVTKPLKGAGAGALPIQYE
ncbi:Septum formation [Micromonospora pattaloongensis]|uniref:Septum formation n=1 Tax=Micromonospora pattaloongensis TaxID=405436 RepID=A0A1H3H8I9_9ACTN|nr:septum formation family protein [Micromonospora pattaloongensis]SDY11680.1 Septum formation [Micromonospora pattaloongensis]